MGDEVKRIIRSELSDDLHDIDRRDVALHPKKRNKLWIWIAIPALTGRVLAIEMGSRGAKTLKRLWARLQHLKPFYVATDEWKVYRKVFPKSLLVQTKKLTARIESTNSRVRHYLARFHRKTFCYSKSPHMAETAKITHDGGSKPHE